MIPKDNYVKFAQFVLLAVSEEAKKMSILFHSNIIKQLLYPVFVISRIIKVSVIVIRRSLRLLVITPTSTLFILDITKSSSNNCLLSFVANFSSFSLAESPPSDLQITAYK